jgi:hypothetical protein
MQKGNKATALHKAPYERYLHIMVHYAIVLRGKFLHLDLFHPINFLNFAPFLLVAPAAASRSYAFWLKREKATVWNNANP